MNKSTFVLYHGGAWVILVEHPIQGAAQSLWGVVVVRGVRPVGARVRAPRTRIGFLRRVAVRCMSLLKPVSPSGLSECARQLDQENRVITVGSSIAGSGGALTPGVRTPGRVTKAGGLGKGSNPLDSFFPFDPYLLRRSHVYVEDMYNTWKVGRVEGYAEGARASEGLWLRWLALGMAGKCCTALGDGVEVCSYLVCW